MHIIHKNIGETSLAALKRFRKEAGKPDERLSYAGRLDPMASGQLLLLEGEENDRRDKFLSLDKTYEFSILFGVGTDTFDLLGLVDKLEVCRQFSVDKIKETLQSFVREWEMEYPPYSAKTVTYKGKMIPLWQLTRADKLQEIEMPTKNVKVYSVGCKDIKMIDKDYIINYIINYIKKLPGDFRQEDTIARWQQVLADIDTPFQLASCSVSGSSGLYVRRLAYEVGKQLGCQSLAFSIERTEIDVSI
jgi:tRNA pseudouridine55 synthase